MISGCSRLFHSIAIIFILMLLDKLYINSARGSTMFKNVCLGGTFDGIHAGHKLLFGEATKICTERLVVGVTDSDMIRNKTLWELIAPVDERMQKVRECLIEVNPNLNYHIVPIKDIYGPTITEMDLDCIVVSEETIKGAQMINEERNKKGWHRLKVHVINLLKDGKDIMDKDLMARLNEKKVSSSLMRINKLGTILKSPEPNKSIPNKPYLIGLTGGIASGKTAIGKYLESLGFGYINYDLLGHKTYAKIDSPIYREIVEYFGNEILDEATKQIDRAKLGKIVFGDKTKLDKLNQIVWPGIYALVDSEIEMLKDKHDVIVLESALLIESGQAKRVHQVWTTIVPIEEAIRRQVESRGLDKEEAKRRVEAQTDNLTRIKHSNAVFCSLWDVDFTRQQVNKCVDELKSKYLN